MSFLLGGYTLIFRGEGVEGLQPPLKWFRKKIEAYFITLPRYRVFSKLKVGSHLASNESVGTLFPSAFTHFVSLCHILVIFTIFQMFSLLLYLLWSSVILAIITGFAKGSDDA